MGLYNHNKDIYLLLMLSCYCSHYKCNEKTVASTYEFLNLLFYWRTAMVTIYTIRNLILHMFSTHMTSHYHVTDGHHVLWNNPLHSSRVCWLMCSEKDPC